MRTRSPAGLVHVAKYALKWRTADVSALCTLQTFDDYMESVVSDIGSKFIKIWTKYDVGS